MVEVVDKPINQSTDELAQKIFYKSIDLLGGLFNLAKYRNLTWLPTLAESAYVIAMHKESALTSKQIAEKLGLSTQTVTNILRAKEIDQIEALEENEKIQTHKAGSIAKLAYKKILENE